MLKVLIISSFFFLFRFGLIAQPFSVAEIGASVSYPSSQSSIYSERWNLTESRSFHFRTPFYFGKTGFNIEFFDYETRNESNSDASSINLSTYFGFDIIKSKFFKLTPGIFVGMQRLNSATRSRFSSNSIELELFYSASLEPQIVFNRIIIFGDFQYRRIYNFYRQDIFFGGMGIKLQLDLPKRIRSILD
ncbi:MAG: hypothetical protein RLO03_08555 [Balneola sp.]